MTQRIWQLIILLVLTVLAPTLYAKDYLMSDKTYRKLNAVQQLMAEKAYDKALEKLKDIRPQQRYKNYEQSLIDQNMAYIFLEKAMPERAIEYYQKCLSRNSMPGDSLNQIRVDLMYLYLDGKSFDQVVKLYSDWKQQGGSDLQVKMLAAYAYFSLKQLDASQQIIEQLLAQEPEKVKEDWLLLLFDIYQTKQLWRKQQAVLTRLIKLNPDKGWYWLQLANTCMQLKDNEKAVSLTRLAKANGLIKEPDLLMFALDLFVRNGLPFDAAKLLQYGRDKGLVKANEKQDLQVSFLIQAKEFDQAIELQKKIVARSNVAKNVRLLAQLYQQQAYYKPLIELLSTQASLDDVDREMLVRALVDEGKLEEARSQLVMFANEDKKNSWRKVIDAELERKNRIASLLKDQ